MDPLCAQPSCDSFLANVPEILQDLDDRASLAEKESANHRKKDRRKFRVDCDVRYQIPRCEAVLNAKGVTRDISPDGIGFVAAQQLPRHSSVVVSVSLPDGRIKNLPGTVVHTRRVRRDRYLVGVRFGHVDVAKIMQPDSVQSSGTVANAPDDITSKESLSPQERAIKFLRITAGSSLMSQETVMKVVRHSASSDQRVRHATIPALLQIGGRDGRMTLINLLNDVNASIQGEAAEALGLLQAKEAIDPLRGLVGSDNDELAIRAAEALFALGDKVGRRVAVNLVQRDIDLNRRAARLLGQIDGHTFRPNDEGVAKARKYLATTGEGKRSGILGLFRR